VSDECPKCGGSMKRSSARLHKGLIRRRCSDCRESDYAWLTLAQIKARLEDATAGEIKSAILSLALKDDAYRGVGDAREYSPDAQLAVIQALREKAVAGRRTRRST
jgi:hypothetical protein